MNGNHFAYSLIILFWDHDESKLGASLWLVDMDKIRIVRLFNMHVVHYGHKNLLQFVLSRTLVHAKRELNLIYSSTSTNKHFLP